VVIDFQIIKNRLCRNTIIIRNKEGGILAKLKINNFPSIRITEKLKTETDKACEIEQENVSEYVRRSVEDRNKKVLKGRV